MTCEEEEDRLPHGGSDYSPTDASIMCLDECTHDWLGNPVNEWAFVQWRDPQGSLTTPLAAERVERSGNTAKKCLASWLVFGHPNQNVQDMCTVKRH